ncbi:MAG TPA: pyridoxamine 5'-phosphate oxidase family protein [Candidatus Saccharimonadales bacterium]|nr:pyridoxamine 5'-phosphate oxidase family protein [Candidatus Saccharimonadales bacterium]
MQSSLSAKNPEIAEFLARNHIAVLATVGKQSETPHAAVIYYTTTSKLNIFFVTKIGTQKSRNLESNPLAALVVYDPSAQKTIQFNGTAKRIDDPNRLQTALEIMAKYSEETANTKTLPISRLDAGDYVLYKVTPQNIRMGEYRYATDDHIFSTAVPELESLE